MSIYELDIGWALTASERRRLCWELIASDEVSRTRMRDTSST